MEIKSYFNLFLQFIIKTLVFQIHHYLSKIISMFIYHVYYKIKHIFQSNIQGHCNKTPSQFSSFKIIDFDMHCINLSHTYIFDFEFTGNATP